MNMRDYPTLHIDTY